MFSRLNQRTLVSATLLTALAVTFCCPIAHSQLPRTRLNTIFPPSGKAGSDLTVTINGDLASAATELIFSHPDIEATQQIESPSEYRVAHRRQRTFDVRIGPTVPNGRYEVRAFGPAGLSNPRIFVVSRFSQKRFSADKNSRDNPFAVAADEIASATARADVRDYYRFTAKAGQSLLVQVWAERIDSRMDAVLAVYDAATGRRLERVVQGMTRDPILTFIAPADGEYVVEVGERTYRGGEDYAYLLEVSQRPHVDTIFPTTARNGQEQEFEIYGFNLPGGEPVSGTDNQGHLQLLKLTFTPDFAAAIPFAAGLCRGTTASAMIDGASVELPVPLSSANCVFLEKSSREITIDTQPNDQETVAQQVTVPCTVAGRFYPREDVDWFQFDAKKGQTWWIEVAAHQLGSVSDPVLRIRKRKMVDGQPTFSDVASSDDIEGPPNSRDSRRFYSGTGDAAVRFRPDEDGTYLVSVRDQYNVSSDDPRLIYRLSIEPQQPDFQLIAFADPERHADEKIAKPNGVSVIPGATTPVRVRLLPRHGFDQPVQVVAENLPEGVTAEPAILSSRLLEGFLMLSASADAKPDVRSLRIVGTSRRGNEDVTRLARTGTILRDVNNVDSEATKVRLTRDFLVAVAECDQLPPAELRPGSARYATSLGGKLTMPIKVARRDDFTSELQLVALQVPKGIKVDGEKTKEDRVELKVSIEDAKLPPGRYTFPVAAKVKEKRPRNPIPVKEAEADLKKIVELLAQRDEALKDQEQGLAENAKEITAIEQKQVAAQSQAAEPKNKLAVKLEEQRQAATELAQKLSASLQDVGNAALRDEVAKAEAALKQLQTQRQELQEQLGEAAKPLEAISAALAERKTNHSAAQKELESLKAKRTEAEQQKAEVEKRLGEVRKAELEQDAEFWIYSSVVQLDVEPSPVVLATSQSHQLNPGESYELPFTVRRRFGFDGQIAAKLTLPADSGILAAPLVLGPGQQSAKFLLATPEDVTSRGWDATIEINLKYNNIDIKDVAKCRVEVVEK